MVIRHKHNVKIEFFIDGEYIGYLHYSSTYKDLFKPKIVYSYNKKIYNPFEYFINEIDYTNYTNTTVQINLIEGIDYGRGRLSINNLQK